MSGRNVYFMPRAQAQRARSFGAEPRLIVPARRISAPVEPPHDPNPKKLSYDEALRCFGVHQASRHDHG